MRSSSRAELHPDFAASPTLFYEFAQLKNDRMFDYLEEPSDGGVVDVEYDGDDCDWILGLTMRAKHTIDATSLELGRC
jgi:hypothetical protein